MANCYRILLGLIMNSKEYRKVFNTIAQENGFEKAFGGWFKESQECILVLDLQKSNFGDYYEMNIKVFVQGAFGNSYVKNKNLVKKDIGDIFTRQPAALRDVLIFDDVQSNFIPSEIGSLLIEAIQSKFSQKNYREIARLEDRRL